MAICAAALGMLGLSATAVGEPFPSYALTTPADGTTLTVGTDPISFEFVSAPLLHDVKLEISRSTLPGQDGTLANDFLATPWEYLGESDVFPGAYRTGSVRLDYLTVGTYYFQFSGGCYGVLTECGGAGYGTPQRRYVGPVHVLEIAAPSEQEVDDDYVPITPRCRTIRRRISNARLAYSRKRRAFRRSRRAVRHHDGKRRVMVRRRKAMVRSRRRLIRARQAFRRDC